MTPAGLLHEQSLKEGVWPVFEVKGGQTLWAIRSLEFYAVAL